MKVLYVLPISWGGIPHYTAELANAMAKYADVVILKPEDSNDNLFSESVKIINAFRPMRFSREKGMGPFLSKNIINFFSFRRIRQIIKINPDIIHFPELYAHTNFFMFLYKLCTYYPVICTRHAVFQSPIHNLNFGILTPINRLSAYLVKPEKIIVHTRRDRYILIKKGVNRAKIAVIPHGIFSFFKKYNQTEIKNENCILFFGYVEENKGVKFLVRAIPIVSKKISDIKVIIAGEGDLSKYSRYITDKSKFKIYNEFIPNSMVAKLFQQAKVVVLPYIYHKGHSGVLTIAFAFGKPVVVTNVGSLPELVKNGKEGFIVPPRDPKALANAIIKILEDSRLRKKMSRNALKKAEELSWDRIAKMHIKVYEEVLEEWKSRRI